MTALAACSPNVLDFRNATINNGLIYQGDSNEPFTGKVTNVPEAQVLLTQQPIRTFFQSRNAVYLEQNPSMLDKLVFSTSLCDIKVEDGILDGRVICKYPQTDAKRYDLGFAEGKLDGDITFFGPPPHNVPVVQGSFKQGVLDGPLEVFSAQTQKPLHRQTLKNGVNHGEVIVWSEKTGNETERAKFVDGKLEGPAARYAPDGKTVIFRATYANSLYTGVMETFDPSTGAPTLKSEWRAGKRNGVWKKWEDGKLIEDHVYQDDTLISKAEAAASPGPVDTSACENAWLTAHRKQVGPDAAISTDQLAEWQSWCASGKAPS